MLNLLCLLGTSSYHEGVTCFNIFSSTVSRLSFYSPSRQTCYASLVRACTETKYHFSSSLPLHFCFLLPFVHVELAVPSWSYLVPRRLIRFHHLLFHCTSSYFFLSVVLNLLCRLVTSSYRDSAAICVEASTASLSFLSILDLLRLLGSSS